jgi:hypothetical protein
MESEIKKAPCKVTYKDSLKPLRLPFVFRLLFGVGKKWPWVSKIMKWILFILVFPFQNLLKKMPGSDVMHLQRLYQDKKYEEGFQFAVEKLSNWSNLQKSNFTYSVHDFMWFDIFDQAYYCAAELNRSDTLLVLTELLSKVPETSFIHRKASSFCQLSRLAWKLNQQEAAYQWVEKAIELDDTHAPSYILKGWYDVVLEKGQPLVDIFHGLQIDPKLKESVFADQVFIDKAQLLEDLERKLSESKK